MKGVEIKSVIELDVRRVLGTAPLIKPCRGEHGIDHHAVYQMCGGIISGMVDST